MSRRLAMDLEETLRVLLKFDEGADLVLYYKHLMVLEGCPEYEHHFVETDSLTLTQQAFATAQWKLFERW